MEKTQLLVFANIAAITYEDPKTARTNKRTNFSTPPNNVNSE